MHTRALEPKHGPTILVRPLRHGDVRTVMTVFERLSEQSRRSRFKRAEALPESPELSIRAAIA